MELQEWRTQRVAVAPRQPLRRPFVVSQPTHAPGSGYKPRPRLSAFGMQSIPIKGAAQRVATPLAERTNRSMGAGATSDAALRSPVPFAIDGAEGGANNLPGEAGSKDVSVNLTKMFESDRVQGAFMADIFADICVGTYSCDGMPCRFARLSVVLGCLHQE